MQADLTVLFLVVAALVVVLLMFMHLRLSRELRVARARADEFESQYEESVKDYNVLFAAHNEVQDRCADMRENMQVWSQELGRREGVLLNLGSMNRRLLQACPEGLEEAICGCLGQMAEHVNADRVRVWRNYTQDGKLYGDVLFEWTGNAEGVIGTPLGHNVSFEAHAPLYAKLLAGGDTINGPIASLSVGEQAMLRALGVVSLVEVPIMQGADFWGSIAFDDCHSKRYFSDQDEEYLQYGTMMLANVITRVECVEKDGA